MRAVGIRIAQTAAVAAILWTLPGVARPASAQDGRRIALVVGNDAYAGKPLRNAVNDSKAIAAALGRHGFEVQVAHNTTLQQLARAVDRFVGSLRPNDVAIAYYSGHGIQVQVDSQVDNYLVPVDFDAKDERDAPYQSYSASRLVDRMTGTGASLAILILDACRENPFGSTRRLSRGLAAMNGASGSLIAFATAPGSTADDNPGSSNGLFTSHLLKVMEEPSLTIEQVFSRVRQEVFSASQGRQRPWTVSSVIGDFYLARPAAARTAPPAPAPAPAAAVALPAASAPALRLAYLSTKATQDAQQAERIVRELGQSSGANLLFSSENSGLVWARPDRNLTNAFDARVRGQSSGPVAVQPVNRVAYVNIQRLASESTSGKAATVKIRALSDERLRALNEKNRLLESNRQRLQQGSTILSDSARSQLERDIARQETEVKRATEDAQTAVNSLQQQLQADFQKALMPVLESVCTGAGIDILFSAADAGLVWASPASDATNEVLRRLEGGAAAAIPSIPVQPRGAVVNVQRIANESALGKAFTAQVLERRNRWAADLTAKNATLQGLKQKLASSGTVLSDAGRQELERQIARAQVDVDRSKEDANGDVAAFQQQLQDDFQKTLMPVVEAIAVERGLHLVFSETDSGFLWKDAATDLTAVAVGRLDATRTR